jgi:hypothetical protein
MSHCNTALAAGLSSFTSQLIKRRPKSFGRVAAKPCPLTVNWYCFLFDICHLCRSGGLQPSVLRFGASIDRGSRGLSRIPQQERLSFRHCQREYIALGLSQESEPFYARCMRLVVWPRRAHALAFSY